MKFNNMFNWQRFSHLIINDLRLHLKTILIVSVTLLICLILLPLDTRSFATYQMILFIGGFIITGLAFNDLHDRNRAHAFLMLPCSHLERFLSRWLLTSLMYALGVLIFYYVFSTLNSFTNAILFKQPFLLLNIFEPTLWIEIGKYIILQSVVLLGAIVFKRYALIKTILVTSGFIFFLIITSLLITWKSCPNCFLAMSETIAAILKGGYFIFWIILAPICWYLTYLRLTEYELQ